MQRSLLVVVLGLLTTACQFTPIKEVNDRYRSLLDQRFHNYRLKWGDTISIKFYNQDTELNQTFTVLPDGRADPYFMDDVVVAGKTVKELEADIKKYYAEQVKSFEISVLVTSATENVIVEGEVNKPAIVPYTPQLTLMQALGIDGGYKITTCLHQIVVRRAYTPAGVYDPEHPDVLLINLRNYEFVKEDLYLLPNDHVIVQKNLWITARDYVREYVWGWLPPFFSYLPGLAAI